MDNVELQNECNREDDWVWLPIIFWNPISLFAIIIVSIYTTYWVWLGYGICCIASVVVGITASNPSRSKHKKLHMNNTKDNSETNKEATENSTIKPKQFPIKETSWNLDIE